MPEITQWLDFTFILQRYFKTGKFRIRTFPSVNLNDVKKAIFDTFAKVEAESFTTLCFLVLYVIYLII